MLAARANVRGGTTQLVAVTLSGTGCSAQRPSGRRTGFASAHRATGPRCDSKRRLRRLAPGVAMLETPQARARNHRRLPTRLVFNRSAIRCVLTEAVRESDPRESGKRSHGRGAASARSFSGITRSRISRRQPPTHLSAIPACQGAWTLVRLGFQSRCLQEGEDIVMECGIAIEDRVQAWLIRNRPD